VRYPPTHPKNQKIPPRKKKKKPKKPFLSLHLLVLGETRFRGPLRSHRRRTHRAVTPYQTRVLTSLASLTYSLCRSQGEPHQGRGQEGEERRLPREARRLWLLQDLRLIGSIYFLKAPALHAHKNKNNKMIALACGCSARALPYGVSRLFSIPL
jgi:hypothetical protein